MGFGAYEGKLFPEYAVTTLRSIRPRKNRALSAPRLVMIRVIPASVPQNCLAISRADAVHRL